MSRLVQAALSALLVVMAMNANAFAGDTTGTDEVTCLRASDMYLVQGSPAAPQESAAPKQLVFQSHGKHVAAVSSELIGVEGTVVNTAYAPGASVRVASRFQFQFQPAVALK